MPSDMALEVQQFFRINFQLDLRKSELCISALYGEDTFYIYSVDKTLGCDLLR